MEHTIQMGKANVLGMMLDVAKYESCYAQIGTGDNWATVYFINSKDQGKGHATILLKCLQKHYESKGKKFGSSISLSAPMKHLLQKLNIPEYK